MSRLDEIISEFQSVDDELRLAMLLDFANRLPPLPPEFAEQRDRGEHRVPECMTPVFLWVVREDDGGEGRIRLHADVAEESPTVRGILSLVVHAYDGAAPRELASLPTDLVNRLGLQRQIRMNRAVGLNAILQRIRREAGVAAQPAGEARQ